MARRAVLKLLLLLLIMWHCDAKSSSTKASLKKSTTAAPVVKQEAVTTVKPEEPSVSSTSGPVDPKVPSLDAKDEPQKDDVEPFEIPEDVNITSSIGTKTVTSRKCNKRDRVNEVFSQCGNNACQNTCANPNTIAGCTGTCVAGCICVPGFLRNALGRCVLPSQCDSNSRPVCTGPNEIFSFCGNDGCQASCNRLNTAGCIAICNIPACVCAAGFVRNAQGICVLPSSCPSSTCNNQNEVFSQCGNNGCQATCDRLNLPNICQPICGNPGCVCAPGFVRNSVGICVLPSQCPSMSCTGANEVFSQCGEDGCQRTCNRLDVTGCQAICSTPRCVCNIGFVRNGIGACVLPSSCPSMSCPGTNEIFSFCGNDGCQRSCTRLDVTGCISSCNVPACVCVNGFVRNQQGICVLPAACPSTTICGANEVFSNCGNDGCQRSCTRLVITNCFPVCTTASCVCAAGFVRNSAGVCVPPTACPTTMCNGANEVFSACGNDGCQPTCTTPVVTGCVSTCSNPGCICASGFVRNVAGVCVLPSACVMPCNGANQVFSACGNDGCQRSCTRLDVTGCVSTCGTPACICAPGFVLNAAGACVLPSTCPSVTCAGANQIFSACGNDNCQRSCTRLVVTGCNPTCGAPGCICAPGFVLDATGACVLPTACPMTTCPGQNQIFSACGNDNCQRSCTRLVVTGCNPICGTPGCICAPGFVTSATGACILPTACPATTCGTNEVFSGCGNDNCQRTCTMLIVPATCVPVCNAAACICASGFVRNAQGACVPPSSCPVTTCLANQVFSGCGIDGCQSTCTTPAPNPCTSVCSTPACVCAPGFVMNAGTCIAPTQCPLPTCPANEVFSQCGNDGCRPTCANQNRVGCVPVCGIPACICAPGFVRNAANVCVPPVQCPMTCANPNEVFSTCGDNGCQRTCQRQDLTGCVPVCTVPACVCATGFVRNTAGQCVLPSACPMVCTAANEVFSMCGNNMCQATCAFTPPLTCMGTCFSGCICNAGFLRNAQGVCVLAANCNAMATCGMNEQPRACGVDVCESTCANPMFAMGACSTAGVCTNGCFCVPGFVRLATGMCANRIAC